LLVNIYLQTKRFDPKEMLITAKFWVEVNKSQKKKRLKIKILANRESDNQPERGDDIRIYLVTRGRKKFGQFAK
jgi:sugar lactone lactonase YvrE